MKKLILAAAFLIGSAISAFAACTGPAVMHDFPGTSFNMSLATTPDGNCGSNVAITTWGGISLGAASNYGTSPGAVAVPGVNAFITNVPAVSQSGTWTVQPGNTANTTAWLVTGTGGVFPSSQSGTWTVQPGNTANTTPWLQSISQGGSTAVVKAANTVATTDVGLVVAVANTLAPGQAAGSSSSPVVVAKNSGTGSTVAGAAVGTAGSASAEVVTVQGVASMTPFLSNPGTAANWGIGATAAAVPANAMYNAFNSGGNLVGVAAATPLPSRPGDGTRNAIIDPCEANLQSYTPISITTATTTRIVAPSASNKTYICLLFLTSAAADNIGIVEGTGGTCGTGTAGVVGGTTAANGPNFAANGGMLLQAGGKVAAAQTAGTNVDLCLITSAATPLAGGIKYVQAP